MPLYELTCAGAEDCPNRHRRIEAYFPSFDSPNPKCKRCGGRMQRMFSRFAMPFMKPLRAYDDPKLENFNPDAPGVIAFRRQSTRNLDGTPERVVLKTVQEQRAYCRAEGLIPPDDCGMCEVDKDGKSLSVTGFAGQWGGTPSALVKDSAPTEAEAELDWS